MKFSIGLIVSQILLGATLSAQWILDFDDPTVPVVNGEVITDQYLAKYGVSIDSVRSLTNPTSRVKPAIIFDSTDTPGDPSDDGVPTGGDTDLETPNPSGHASNVTPLENVLIVSEDKFYGSNDANYDPLPGGGGYFAENPDDNAGGGTLMFTFLNNPVVLNFAEILDIEESGGSIVGIKTDGSQVSESLFGLGDSSYQNYTFNQTWTDIETLFVDFAGSGAVASIGYTEIPEPRTTAAIGLVLLLGFLRLKKRLNKSN